MNRSTLLRAAAFAAVIAAIIFGFPQRLFHRVTPLRAVADRPALPDFTLPAVSGGSWSVGENRHKVMLVNFWATWCPPCRAETPELVRIHERYANQGVSVVGITLDEDPSTLVPQFIRQFKVSYPVLLPGPEFSLARNVESLPTTLLIDRKGRVAKTYFGQLHESDASSDIEQLLKETD